MNTDILPRHSDELLAKIQELEATIQRLQFNTYLDMYNQAGLMRAIDQLPDGVYIVIFADIDHMKALNSATGSHDKTNHYLAAGLKVRQAEIAGQLFGDEIVFILEATDADAFCQRIGRQLAAQPLSPAERCALYSAGSQPYLSATFAHRSHVAPDQIRSVIAQLSVEVLAQKKARDSR